MKHLINFLASCFGTAKNWLEKAWTPKRGIVFLVLLLQFFMFKQVSNPQAGSYVTFQQVEGIRSGSQVAQADPEKELERVNQFVSNLVLKGFDWQPGLAVEEQKIVYPQNFHLMSFYFDMESDLRQKWLLSRVVAYQKSGFSFEKFLKGQYLSTVTISGPPLVKKLSDKQWQADVMAVRVVLDSDRKTNAAAYKEKLSFRFILQKTQPRTGHEWGLEQSPWNKALNSIQAEGLMITDFQELT